MKVRSELAHAAYKILLPLPTPMHSCFLLKKKKRKEKCWLPAPGYSVKPRQAQFSETSAYWMSFINRSWELRPETPCVWERDELWFREATQADQETGRLRYVSCCLTSQHRLTDDALWPTEGLDLASARVTNLGVYLLLCHYVSMLFPKYVLDGKLKSSHIFFLSKIYFLAHSGIQLIIDEHW